MAVAVLASLFAFSILDRSFSSQLNWDVAGSLVKSPVENSKDNLDGPDAKPDLLIIASLHGSGTTMLSNAMHWHPCVISVGEPFGGNENLYAPVHHIKDGDVALFHNNSKPDPEGTYTKLQSKVDAAVGKPVNLGDKLQMQAAGIYDFFSAVRTAACGSFDLPKQCKGRCIFAHKIFPDYVYNDFEQTRDYLLHPRTAVVHLQRNEAEVASSNARRFNGYSQEKIMRDKDWNQFLNKLSAHKPPNKIWHDIDADKIFRGSNQYMNALEKVFIDLGLGEEKLLKQMRRYLDYEFATFASANTSSHTPR